MLNFVRIAKLMVLQAICTFTRTMFFNIYSHHPFSTCIKLEYGIVLYIDLYFLKSEPQYNINLTSGYKTINMSLATLVNGVHTIIYF